MKISNSKTLIIEKILEEYYGKNIYSFTTNINDNNPIYIDTSLLIKYINDLGFYKNNCRINLYLIQWSDGTTYLSATSNIDININDYYSDNKISKL